MTGRWSAGLKETFLARGVYLAPAEPGSGRSRIALACIIIFSVAVGVRLLHWLDIRSAQLSGETIATTLVDHYQQEAFRIVRDGGVLIPRESFDSSDGRLAMHPPAYSILLALIYGKEGPPDRSYWVLRLLQIICDAAAGLLVFTISVQLVPRIPAFVAGILAALSPHFADYSLWLTPDSLAVLPILISICLLARATLRPRLATVIGAGVMIGVSCWLRSNALLLAPFLATVTLPLFKSGVRLRYWVGLVGATLVLIAPITIRNWVVYRQFIPLSLGSGITMAEGIAEYDKEGRFGLPRDDSAAGRQEAEMYERPEYQQNLFTPDGIERERNRTARALAVIRSNPAWFLRVMARRMRFMLRYNDFHRQEWTHNTTIAPPVSRDPGYGGEPSLPDGAAPVWSSSPTEMAAAAQAESPEGTVTVREDGEFLEVAAGTSGQKSVISVGSVTLTPGRDYILSLPIRIEEGALTLTIKGADPRVTLGLRSMEKTTQNRRPKKRAAKADRLGELAEQPAEVVQLPFASQKTSEVRFVISGGEENESTARWQVGRLELFEIGPTPFQWTRLPRIVAQGLQKNIFKTDRLLSLIAIGLALLALARRGRALVLLGAVPAYYLCVQSVFHTEYRYILAIHYFLFVFAATALFAAVVAIGRLARRDA